MGKRDRSSVDGTDNFVRYNVHTTVKFNSLSIHIYIYTYI